MFTDTSFPADETMLSWKEYPRTVGGLAKYLSWFKEFKRPRDLQHLAHGSKGPHSYVSLFGKQYEQTGRMAACAGIVAQAVLSRAAVLVLCALHALVVAIAVPPCNAMRVFKALHAVPIS